MARIRDLPETSVLNPDDVFAVDRESNADLPTRKMRASTLMGGIDELAERAEGAADRAELYAAEAALKGTPIYEFIDGMDQVPVPDDLHTIWVNHKSDLDDSGGGHFIDQDNGTPVAFTSAAGAGATARDWYLVAERASPGQFGGDRSGSTLSSAALQAAIDYMSAIGGGEVFIPSGTWLLDDHDSDGACVILRSGVVLVGAGEKSVLKMAPDQNCALVKAQPAATGIGLKSLVLDGARQTASGSTLSGSHMGFRGTADSAGLVIKDAVFKNFRGRALETNGDTALTSPLTDPAEDIAIDNVQIIDCNTKNLHVRRSRHVTVSNCRVITDGIPDDGGVTNDDNCSAFEASHSHHVAFVNCLARHKSDEWGVSLRAVNGSYDVSYIGCKGLGGRQGVSIADVSLITVEGCVLIDSYIAGMTIQAVGNDPAWAEVTDITIANNVIINPEGYGISVSVTGMGVSVENARILNNTIRGGSAGMNYGLRVVGDVDAYEAGNKIYNAQTSEKTGAFRRFFDDLQALSVKSGSVIIADDTVAIIPAPNGGRSGVIEVTMRQIQGWSAKAMYRSEGTANLTELYNGQAGRINFVSTPLDGTTGDDTDLNVGVDTAGNIYIENRAGATRTIDYTFTNAA